MIDLESFVIDCQNIKERGPLIHNITNYVAMNLCANSLLAIGASPLMSFYDKEMEEIVEQCDALVVNIGCLDERQIEGMRAASSAAKRLGKPWVLDPVGVGVSKVRTQLALELISDYKPSIIRGNASEILSLDGSKANSHGVDAADSSESAVEAAQRLAQRFGTVISISGPVDYIVDAHRVERISNGSPLMPKVSALGCTASAITAAFAAVDPEPFCAALNAMALMGVAGQRAASVCKGSGSFPVCFLDELSCFKPELYSAMISQ